jgi:hypothetical protein
MWNVEYTDEFGEWWNNGGNKKGDDNWYDKYIPLADKLYD